MAARKLCVLAVLAFGLGLIALVVAVLPASSVPSESRALPLEKTLNPCGGGFRIEIVPRLPTLADTVSVIYSAGWANTCVPVHHSHQITSNVIIVDAVHYISRGQLCAPAITL
jgi:hypothetical protein